jgi:hypothetical protein
MAKPNDRKRIDQMKGIINLMHENVYTQEKVM